MVSGLSDEDDSEDNRPTNPWGVPLPGGIGAPQIAPAPTGPTPPWGVPLVIGGDATARRPVPAPQPAAPTAPPAPPVQEAPPVQAAPPTAPVLLPPLAPSPSSPAASLWPVPPPSRRSRRARMAVVATFTVLGLTAATSWGYVGYQGLVQARTIAVSPLPALGGQGAVATSPSPAQSAEPGLPVAAVQGLVAGLQSAIAARDEDAFVAGVDPQASDFADHWRSVFRGITRVGLSDVRFAVDPARLEEWDHDGYAESVFAPVAITYSIKGFDPAPVSTVVGLTFGLRDGTWWLVDDEGGQTRLPMGEFYEPWLIGDVGVARRPHVVVVGDVKRTADNERLATSLERAAAAVRAAVPAGTWNGKVVAFASTDPTFINAWFGTQAATPNSGGAKEPATIAAEVRPMPGAPVYDTLAEFEPASARIAVTPLVLQGKDPRGEAVLRHEITHVALALTGNGRVSTWLVEGMAEYVAYRSVSGSRVSGTGALARRGLAESTWAQLRRGTWKPTLDNVPGVFYVGTTQKVSERYTSGWFACLYIASKYGEKKLFALYRAQAAADRDTPATEVETRTLKEVLGIDKATLARQTAAYARTVRSSFA